MNWLYDHFSFWKSIQKLMWIFFSDLYRNVSTWWKYKLPESFPDDIRKRIISTSSQYQFYLEITVSTQQAKTNLTDLIISIEPYSISEFLSYCNVECGMYFQYFFCYWRFSIYLYCIRDSGNEVIFIGIIGNIEYVVDKANYFFL